MKMKLEKNWTTDNNGFALNDSEVQRYISVVPNENQLTLQEKPFYAFFHFGMNTANDRDGAQVLKLQRTLILQRLNPNSGLRLLRMRALQALFSLVSTMTDSAFGIQNIRISML